MLILESLIIHFIFQPVSAAFFNNVLINTLLGLFSSLNGVLKGMSKLFERC